MTKYLFSIIFLTSTIVLSAPWMPRDAKVNPNNSSDRQTNVIGNVNAVERAKSLDNQLFEQGKNYANNKIQAYYEGLENYYSKMKNQRDYYSYKSIGYFDYMPSIGNNFPAPVDNAK